MILRSFAFLILSSACALAQVPIPLPPPANPPCTKPTLDRTGLIGEFNADFYGLGFVDGYTYPAGYTPPNGLSYIPDITKTPQFIDHTPWGGDFGGVGGNFNGDRFKILQDQDQAGRWVSVLRIQSSKDAAKNWHSGILSTLDGNGVGFKTRGGGNEVIECTAKLPVGIGQWPACWADAYKAGGHELDFMETYGGWPASVHFGDHCWGCSPVTANEVAAGGVRLDPANVYQTYRNYAVEILPNGTEDFYVDNICVGELVPTNPTDALKPMGLLVDLASNGGWGTSGITNPSYMYISALRAWHR